MSSLRTALTATAVTLPALAPAAALAAGVHAQPQLGGNPQMRVVDANHATLNFASDRLARTASGKVDAKITFVNGARVTDIKPVGTHGNDIRYTATRLVVQAAEAPPEVHGEVPPRRREDRSALRQAVRPRRARLVTAAGSRRRPLGAGGASRREQPHRGKGAGPGRQAAVTRPSCSMPRLRDHRYQDAARGDRRRPRRHSSPLDDAVCAAQRREARDGLRRTARCRR